jgi:hypothetical protein
VAEFDFGLTGSASAVSSAASAASSKGSTDGDGEQQHGALPKHEDKSKRKVETAGTTSALDGAKRQRLTHKQASEPSLPSSALTFEDVLKIGSHVVLAHRVLEEPEVDLWHADIVDVNQASRTFDVRIREWRLLVSDVASNRLFKPSVSLPAV